MKDFRSAMFRGMLLGGPRVGKTTLIPEARLGSQSHDVTGACFAVTQHLSKVNIQWWELSPLERFKHLRKTFYRGAQLAVIVFDVTNRPSFDEVDLWVSELKNSVDEDIPLILVANKTDLEEVRDISLTEGKEKAEELSSHYHESGNHNRPEFFALLDKVIMDMLTSQGFRV